MTLPLITINLFDMAFKHLERPDGRYSSVHQKIAKKVAFVRDQNPYDGITVITDHMLPHTSVQSTYKIGWLLETREVNEGTYNNFESFKDRYDFIMTHDQKLLDEYPDKTRFTVFGGTWIEEENYGVHPKTENVSMIYSDKRNFTGHKLRHEIAEKVSGVEFYGGATPRPVFRKEMALVDYRYSIVIENSKTPNYFTEKLIDSLIVGTIPVYWGAPNIGDFFDVRGMIIIEDGSNIQEVVDSLNEEDYNSRMEYVRKNAELARQYAITEDWMYDNIFKELVARSK